MTNTFQKISAIIYSLTAVVMLLWVWVSGRYLYYDNGFWGLGIAAFAGYAATAVAVFIMAFFVIRAAFWGKGTYKAIIASVCVLVPIIVFETVCTIFMPYNFSIYLFGNLANHKYYIFPVIMTIAIIATTLNILALCFNKKTEDYTEVQPIKPTRLLGGFYGIFAAVTGFMNFWVIIASIISSNFIQRLFDPQYRILYKLSEMGTIIGSILLVLSGIFTLICSFSKTKHPKLLKAAIISFIIFIVCWVFPYLFHEMEYMFRILATLRSLFVGRILGLETPDIVADILNIGFSFGVFCPLGLFTFIKLAKKYNEN